MIRLKLRNETYFEIEIEVAKRYKKLKFLSQGVD